MQFDKIKYLPYAPNFSSIGPPVTKSVHNIYFKTFDKVDSQKFSLVHSDY